MTIKKYSMINPLERKLPTWQGSNLQPSDHQSDGRIQLSHKGWLDVFCRPDQGSDLGSHCLLRADGLNTLHTVCSELSVQILFTLFAQSCRSKYCSHCLLRAVSPNSVHTVCSELSIQILFTLFAQSCRSKYCSHCLLRAVSPNTVHTVCSELSVQIVFTLFA